MFVALPAPAPAIGTPGSPSATVTFDGKQLPPPPLPFGGVIKESYLDSTPYWPPRVVSPKGAPTFSSLCATLTALDFMPIRR
jgi:hypothetical protein